MSRFRGRTWYRVLSHRFDSLQATACSFWVRGVGAKDRLRPRRGAMPTCCTDHEVSVDIVFADGRRGYACHGRGKGGVPLPPRTCLPLPEPTVLRGRLPASGALKIAGQKIPKPVITKEGVEKKFVNRQVPLPPRIPRMFA